MASDREPIFHLALVEEWAAGVAGGRYERSTRDASLAEIGYLHASYRHQLVGVANAFYGDLDELVVVELDRHELGVPVVDEAVVGARDGEGDGEEGERFPHVYGPLLVDRIERAVARRRPPGRPWGLADLVGAG